MGRDVPLSNAEVDHVGPIMEEEDDNKGMALLNQVKSIAMEDRNVLEKGTWAFISYVRAYKEHKLGFIFR